MEEQFGVQRKKFINLMIKKDSELSVVKKSVEQFSSEALRLGQQLRLKEEEVRDMWVATKARESANREAFDADRIKYEEEIASLRRIIEEQCSADLKGTEAWQKGDLLGSELTKERQRSQSPGDPTLQSEMAKAVQESRVLKAVVVPLEEEIDHLRLQLEEARERLQLAEQARQPLTPPLIDLDTPFPSDTSPLPNALPYVASPTPSDGNKLQQQLELERSARHDLEMHTTALEQQKAVLQDETVALRKNLDDMNGKLTAQQESYQQLEQTWKMANQHFVVAQDKLRQQVYFMQQRQLPPRPPSRGSPHSVDVEAMGLLPSRTNTTARSYSLGELREGDGSYQLQTLALENELKRVRKQLEQRSATCGSYEAQLQRVQEQMLEELDEKDQELSRLREECSKARAGVMREREAKEELRRQMEDAREQFKAQVCVCLDMPTVHCMCCASIEGVCSELLLLCTTYR
jgi:chromosome segregation ATPase